MTELAEGVKRIVLPEGTFISTGPIDSYGMLLIRLPQDAVFVHVDNSKRPARIGDGVWFCGKIESPGELKNTYPGQVWALLETKKGKQGGHWRGSNV